MGTAARRRAGASTLVEISAERRHVDKAVIDLVARLSFGLAPAKSERHRRATQSRWGRDVVHTRRRGPGPKARDAQPTSDHSGLSAVLLAREETESRRAYPRPGNAVRLAALHAGQPVDVCAGELPPWARGGEVCHWWRRASVTAAGP